MGKPKIYFSNGPASRSVGLTVEALKLDVEYITVDATAGDNKTPQYISMNPQSTVPTLDDNGKIVWDSHAIIRYLATVYGETDSLCPKEPFLRAKLDQRIHFEDGVLFQKFATVVRPIFHGKETVFDPEAVTALYGAIDLLEVFLKDDAYFVGNNLTVADLCICATLTTIINYFPLDERRHPKLIIWLNKMKQLEYYERANGQPLANLIKANEERMRTEKSM
ncbi:glutathione S-transferase 1-like [Bradysia coprophila]|uniref:glutathione S-transferase 1-like n=1 Tax=Bradysia coprophila TaxID=38358 RepID=UPI00187DAE86|nr:glutathione S-transferase 1-like [Bradysia coprophila]